jgi:hypothetical protein
MPLKVNIKTRLRFNGQEYDSVEAMPPEARAAYERALGQAASVKTFTSKTVTSKIVFNGHEYASPDDLPPDLRAKYDQLMGPIDANHNGVPDILEGGDLPQSADAAWQAAPDADPAMAWMERLAVKQASPMSQMASPRDAANFPVVSEASSNRGRLIIAVVVLLIALAGVAALGLLVWSQIGSR